MTDKLRKEIEVLKEAKYIGSDKYATDYDKRMNEAIDTVVAELEKTLPTDEEICNVCAEHYVFGRNDPIGSRYRSIYEGRRESFFCGAAWMRDLMRKESLNRDKVEFLKSANEPSAVTHPYDLSKK